MFCRKATRTRRVRLHRYVRLAIRGHMIPRPTAVGLGPSLRNVEPRHDRKPATTVSGVT
jgi:hypothetical protein